MRWAAGLMVMLLAANVAAAPQPTLVDLRIDGASRSAIALIDGVDVWVPVDTLCAVRLCREGDLEREGVHYVALAALGDAVTWRFDDSTGVVDIAIATEALAATTISLGVGAPSGIEYGEATSAFVNYALSGELASEQQPRFAGALEAGLSIHGTLAYTSITATDERAVRGISSYTIDDRARLIRVVAGDALVSGGMLGGGGILGGVHVGRDFAIDPYFAARPTLSQSGAVGSPSVIEVYRDGQLVRRDLIPAGPFRIEDLTGTTSGDTRVVVRDAFGLTHAVVAAATAPPPNALKPGLVVFDAGVGMVRERIATTSFDYGAPAGLALIRRGITRRLTLGARAEATPELVSGGAGLIGGFGRFSLSLDGATSRSHGAVGHAGALVIGWQQRAIAVAASARVVDPRYATIDLLPATDRALRAADLSATIAVTRAMSTAVQLGAERMRDRGDRLRASLTAGAQLGPAHVFVTTAAARSDGVSSAEATITLALSHGKRTTTTHAATASDRGLGGASTISRSLGTGVDYGYQATLRHDRATTGFAELVGQGSAGRASLTGQWNGNDGRISAGVTGGVVAIGGRLKAVRPVQGAFALVRIPDVEDVRTYLDNQPVGATDTDGDLVIPDLQAFYGNRLRIDVRDVPVDVSTLTLDRVIAPPRRGGVIVRLAPAPAAVLRGTIVGVRDGERVDVSYGELTLDGARFPIGHAGAFELEGVTAGRHRGAIAIEDARCDVVFEIPSTRGIVASPTLTCRFP
jgi:outer membrane usher protein